MPIRRLIFLCLVLAIVAVLPAASATLEGEVAIGSVLREASLQGLNGPSKNLIAYRGKPLIINVWASWCGPCREEMASLERLAWLDLATQFSIIGISTDDYPEQANALLKNSHATISHFIDVRLQMENMLGASRLPLTVLVDAHGRVLDKLYGARKWDSPETLKLIEKVFGIGYTKGMKTAVSIPDEVFQTAERLARRMKKSRSEIYSRALSEYVYRHSVDETTEMMNLVVAETNEGPNKFMTAAARKVIERSEW